MLPIHDPRIEKVDDKFFATCQCGKATGYSTKHRALQMLQNGYCSHCKRDYRSVPEKDVGIYQNAEGMWCSTCSGCDKEQAYTRKDHAKQSTLADWQCKACAAASKTFSANSAVGSRQRVYNKFRKSALNRKLEWCLTLDEMFAPYSGKCALTGWDLSLKYGETTASLDRIDNAQGYTPSNIQWIHVMVNLCRNKYALERFVEMCCAVAENAKRVTAATRPHSTRATGKSKTPADRS